MAIHVSRGRSTGITHVDIVGIWVISLYFLRMPSGISTCTYAYGIDVFATTTTASIFIYWKYVTVYLYISLLMRIGVFPIFTTKILLRFYIYLFTYARIFLICIYLKKNCNKYCMCILNIIMCCISLSSSRVEHKWPFIFLFFYSSPCLYSVEFFL